MKYPSLMLGLIMGLLLAFESSAQSNYTYKERKADRHYELLAFHKAIRAYHKVIDRNPLNDRAKLKLAESYFKNNDSENAEIWYARIINKSHLAKSVHYLHYAQVLQSNGEFDKSLRWAKKYLSSNPRSEVAQNMVFSLQNVGKYFQDSSKYLVKPTNINTAAAEFAPAFNGDGIVFSSSRSNKVNLKKNYAWDKSKYLDLYQSAPLLGNDMLTEPQKLKGKVNSGMHEGPATIFQENSRIIFTRNSQVKKKDQTVNKLSLYTAIRPAGTDQWQRLEALPFNSKNYSVGHPSMDRSGAVLYYVSDMPGGEGGTDIYKVVYVRGKWGAPQNLGPTVNTPGNEMFPYIDDNDNLYFASNGHPGLGGLDIYQVNLNSSEKEITNMGFPINSTKDDFGLIVKDRMGYFSSNRSGNDDIYQFEMLAKNIDILVKADQHIQFSETTITLRSNGHILAAKTPDDQGRLSFEVAPDVKYELHTEAPGHLKAATSLNPADLEALEVNLVPETKPKSIGTLLTINSVAHQASYILTKDKLIEVKDYGDGKEQEWLTQLISENNIAIEEEVEINPIHYKFDRSTIEGQYQQELEKLALLMKKYQNVEFELGAHTDSRGPAQYNQKLSQQRAISAREFLIDQGVAEERLLAMGYGESKIINNCVDNHPCNNEKHLINRRTEFRLIYMDENQVVSNY